MAVEERPTLRIVVDTNVFVAALLREGIVRKLILENPGTFVTPQACVQEVLEHAGDWNMRGLPLDVLRRTVNLLTSVFISVFSESAYRSFEEEARRLVADPDDAPVVALALAVPNDGIWTFDASDFSSPELLARHRVLTTADVRYLLEGEQTRKRV